MGLFALNCALFVSFVLLALLAGGLASGWSVDAPDFLREEILKTASDRGIRLGADRMVLDLDGFVEVFGIEAGFEDSESDFFSADRVCVKFDVLSALCGKFRFSGLSLSGGRLGAGYATTASAPVLEKLHLEAVRQGRRLDLASAHFDSGPLCASLRGTADLDALAALAGSGRPSGDGAEKSAAGVLNEICIRAEGFHKALSAASRPAVVAEFSIEKGGKIRARARAYADSLSFGAGGDRVLVSDFSAFAAYDSAKNPAGFLVDARAMGLESGFGVRARAVSLSGLADVSDMSLSDAYASVSGAGFEGVEIAYAAVSKPRLSASDLVDGALAYARVGKGFAQARLSGSAAAFSAEFDSDLSVGDILKCRLIPRISELEMFDFRAGLSLQGRVEVSLGAEPSVSARAFFGVQNAALFGVETDSAWGGLEYDSKSGVFWARDVIVISKEGWTMGGDVYQNLKTYDYRFLLAGALRPMAISHFMEKWWGEVFSDFSFAPGAFPYADISVEGTWGNPEIMYVFGHVNADGGIYRGVEFEKASLDVWVNPSRISLLNLRVANGARKLAGALDWTYGDHRITSYDENRVYAVSTLDRRELLALGGERAAEAVEILDFENPPELKLTLFMPNPAKYPDAPDSLNLDYFAPGLTRAGKFDLENFRFRAYMKGDDISLADMSFGCAGGSGSGTLFLSKRQGKDWFEADIAVSGADQHKFTRLLQSLGSGEDAPEEPAQKPKPGDVGVVDGSARLSGFVDDGASIAGGGSASLKNEELAEINILGLISRATSSLGLPVGAFDLDFARSDFSISSGVAEFPNLVVTGPAARISGRARYDFMKDDLNAKLIFAPFASIKTPIVSQIFSMVNPLASVVQIDMTGPFENPKISFALRPLNFFNSEESILENIGARLEDEAAEAIP